MINLYLTRGDGFGTVYLRLPASRAEESRAFAKLDEYITDMRSTRIVTVTSPIPNLDRYLDLIDINGPDYGKLKQLAEQLAGMTEREQNILSGALDAGSVSGLDDILHIAGCLNDYEIMEDVTCDRELGGYLVEHDLLGVDFPEAVRPYLDYVAIGAEYYSGHGGAYTRNGYVKRKENGPEMTADGVQRKNQAQEQKPLVGRASFASGEQLEFTDAEAYLQCIREELPYRQTTGFRYETLTDAPAVCKEVDDILYDLYGEENPRPLKDYENTPQEGLTMGGM